MRLPWIICGLFFFTPFASAPDVAAAQSAPRYNLSVAVDEISLTFHAADAHGLPINDLKLDELRIFDNEKPPRKILAFDISHDGLKLTNQREVIDAGQGTPDGFRVDVLGNLWCGWGMGSDELDGVRIFTPQGEAIGHIALPERCANVCFGGRYRNRLFMAASHGLYSLYVNTQGVIGG